MARNVSGAAFDLGAATLSVAVTKAADRVSAGAYLSAGSGPDKLTRRRDLIVRPLLLWGGYLRRLAPKLANGYTAHPWLVGEHCDTRRGQPAIAASGGAHALWDRAGLTAARACRNKTSGVNG